MDLTFRFDGFDTVYTITGNTATSSSSADGTITITPALANNVANDTRAIYTDDYTNNDVANGIKSLCEKYRFGYVDMRENNPINKYNYTQIMLNDIVHFTDAGYRKYSETCIAGINRYFAVCY